jgi:hypothetical protein
MRYREFVSEDDLSKLKQSVAGKIVALPDTPPVEKTLGEIEDILQFVNAGGRMSAIKDQLVQISDESVNKAQKLLAKYIAGIEMAPKDREELFKLWKEDKLINRKELLSGKMLPIGKIVNGYDTNPAIKELTDDLSRIAFLGQGKGEFVLSVFSKGINKMGKGDLNIDGKAVEVKALDAGGGRFMDQDVKAAPDYASNVAKFLAKYKKYDPSVAKSGYNIDRLINLANKVDDRKDYEADLKTILQNIFPGQDINGILKALMSGDAGKAKQEYSKTNLQYYVSIKNEAEALDGVLYIDLTKEPAQVMYFSDIDQLTKEGLRLHAETIYPVSSDQRNVYPQISIRPTSRTIEVGANKSGDATPDSDTVTKTTDKTASSKKSKTDPTPEEPLGRAEKR